MSKVQLEVDLTPWAMRAVNNILAAGTAKSDCNVLDKEAMAFALQNIVSERVVSAVERSLYGDGIN